MLLKCPNTLICFNIDLPEQEQAYIQHASVRYFNKIIFFEGSDSMAWILKIYYSSHSETCGREQLAKIVKHSLTTNV